MRRWVKGAAIRRTVVNIGLLLTSCLVGLSLCEVSLRLFYPKYRHVADGQFSSDAMRIWARVPNSRDWRNHPDTLVTHSLHHNNLALRQHRDFREADLAAATNIGVFGDSYTENIALPVQYSFTEPLDYLLNQGRERFNVLNFGVVGYGSGQSFLHYEHFRYVEDLDHVLYVYYENDLFETLLWPLGHLDEASPLVVRNETIRAFWWTPFIRRLHISYLVLDVRHRWASSTAETAGNTVYLAWGNEARVKDARDRVLRRARRRQRLGSPTGKDALEVFRQIIRRWKHLAESNGSTFSVVLTPKRTNPTVVDLLTAEDVAIIDLNACFGTHDPAYHDRAWINSPYRFRNDYHWNEAGNQLAALCLYRFLEENVGLPRLSEERLWEALSRYYAAFAGGMPLKTGGGAKGTVSLEVAAAIRKKYLAFDMSNPVEDIQDEFIRSVAQPDKRIIAANFDVYLHLNHLFYVKEDCRPADMETPFFLHMIPVDEKALREPQRSPGFNRRSFTFAKRGFRIGRHGCVNKTPLPPYPVRYIRTGQYVPDQGRLWEGEAWIAPPSVGEEKPKFPVAAGKRIIQSDFDVYLDGRRLVYHKADCRPADRVAPFFLHVTPTATTVLPPDQVRAGFESQDVNSCTIERRLPAYPIRSIRTGQFVRGEGALWEVEFTPRSSRCQQRRRKRCDPQRIVRSVFDVALDGRRLIYSKAECRPADLEARFFLHVIPVDETDLLPSRFPYGFDNLDFSSHPAKFHVNEFGCTMNKKLPAYAIRHLRTGQYIPGQGPLWEGEFAMEQDALEQD